MSDIYYPDNLDSAFKTCKICGDTLEWIECWDCGGEGFGDEFHDCGEDCCCCLDPEPGECPECHGEGGWSECPNTGHHATVVQTVPLDTARE